MSPVTSAPRSLKRAAKVALPRPSEPLSTQPEIRPTHPSALALAEMPTELHFVRNHFGVPVIDPDTWVLELVGAVEHELRISVADLRRRVSHTQTVVLECAGHRRSEFNPSTPGVQWSTGALSEARWTGVPLADLLADVVPTEQACEVVFEGADRGPKPNSTEEVSFSRSIPLERALAGDLLLAWQMNGCPIPPKHGAPLRLIAPGSYGVDSVKWLRRIEVRERPFSGPFQAELYKLLGTAGNGSGRTLPGLRVSALLVRPETGSVIRGSAVELCGVAWGGHGGVRAVEFRLTGETWQQAAIATPEEPHGLTHWSGLLEAPTGEHTIEVRARDQAGVVQPREPEWNALGYANNSIHRVSVTVHTPGGVSS